MAASKTCDGKRTSCVLCSKIFDRKVASGMKDYVVRAKTGSRRRSFRLVYPSVPERVPRRADITARTDTTPMAG